MAASNLVLADAPLTLTPEIQAAIGELFPGRGADLFPLGEQELSFDLDGTTPAVANSLQRVMTQELPGYALHFELQDFASPRGGKPIDPFMAPEFIQNVVQNLRLRHGLQPDDVADVTLRLRVQNPTDTCKPIYAGDLKILRGGAPYAPPLPFLNPTTRIALLQPGSCLEIDRIQIVQSTGRLFAGAGVAIRGRQRPLDFEELPREATHRGFTGAAAKSGYVPDTFTTVAKRHRVTVVVPGTLRGSSTARRLPAQACKKILLGLQLVLGVIERCNEDRAAGRDTADDESSFWVVQDAAPDPQVADAGAGGKIRGTLHLRGESESLTELLRTEMNALVPSLCFIGAARRHDNDAIVLQMTYRGAAEDLSKLFHRAVSNLVALFTSLERQLSSL